MQKLGDAAIPMKDTISQIYDIAQDDKVKILFGEDKIQVFARCPYAVDVCRFLDKLSKNILSDHESKQYSDIVAFGFFIRRSNIMRLADRHVKQFQQQGRGLVFHISPSNVPINFAYTLIFGLLSGNSNIVRISSKYFRQYEIISRVMNQVSDEEELSWVKKTNAVIGYEHDDQKITDYFSSICDARVIWGGDFTINTIRKSPIPPRATEITFSDRFSLAMISIDAIYNMSDVDLKKLAKNFYNDTYNMDQNACSSPHLICWCNSAVEVVNGHMKQEKILDNKAVMHTQKRFWEAVYEVALKYNLEEIKVSEKYTDLCESAINYDIFGIDMYCNILYSVYLGSLPEDITNLRGKFGMFYNFIVDNIQQISRQLNSKKIQTIATVGINKKRLSDYIIENSIIGVDRIVSVGEALNIDVIWDGYDVISALSRNIYTQP